MTGLLKKLWGLRPHGRMTWHVLWRVQFVLLGIEGSNRRHELGYIHGISWCKMLELPAGGAGWFGLVWGS